MRAAVRLCIVAWVEICINPFTPNTCDLYIHSPTSLRYQRQNMVAHILNTNTQKYTYRILGQERELKAAAEALAHTNAKGA